MPLPATIPSDAALVALHQARELLVAKGMNVLGGWALLNLLVSGYLVTQHHRRHESFHFHLMNFGWGLVNAVLAAVSILNTHPGLTSGISLTSLLAEQLHLENILLFNAGLDVAYVATGFWLRAQALAPTTSQPERLAGFGRSLWVKGGFLLVFDTALWLVLHRFTTSLLVLVR